MEELHQKIRSVFPGLERLIGWEVGYDGLHVTPTLIESFEDISKLVWNPLCVHNLSSYLVKAPAVKPMDKTRRIGICVKGCDSRSLVALMQEKFLTREEVFIIGFPCHGTVDVRRLMTQGDFSGTFSFRVDGGHVLVEDAHGLHRLDAEKVLSRRCLHCSHPNPVIYDLLIGDSVTPRVASGDIYRDVEAIERLPVPERLAFWQSELDRCMRCYACRNVCPLCVCQDRCIAETREPKWLTQEMGVREKFLFHMIHALHLAGRCTGCGECERVCPAEIPVALIKEKLNQITREILDYEAGLDPNASPPLLTYNASESGI